MNINKSLNQKYPLIIDGGLSNVLEDFGCNLNNELWVANLLDVNPKAIINTHNAYLEAGAQVISTASYQATIPGFMKLGHSEQEAERLILKSVELSEFAINEFNKLNKPVYMPLIAASIGPYGAYLADGSEYRDDYNISDQALEEFHLRRIEILDNSSSNLLAFETIPSYQEAKVISQLTQDCKTPSWVSFSCKDDKHINDGNPIREVVSLFKDHPTVFALGVNCTAPQYISSLIKEIKLTIGDKIIIVYPNSGESYNAHTKTWMGISDPELFVEMTKEWLSLGADIIGGCCCIGPNHIQRISKTLEKH